MAVCPGGSQPLPGVAPAVFVGSAVMGSLLPAGMAWLPLLVDAFGIVLDLTLPTFCAIDPPPDPGLTGDELAAALSDPTTNAAAVTRQRVTQLLEHFAWYAFCECVSGGQQPLPPAIPEPPGAPAINPPGQTHPPPAAPCATDSLGLFGTDGSSYIAPVVDHPGLAPTGLLTHFGAPTLVGTPTGGTWTIEAVGGQPGNYTVLASLPVQVPASGVVGDIFMSLPRETVRYQYQWVGLGSSGNTIQWHDSRGDVYCAGGTPTSSPCPDCPPDPAIMGALQQLLELVRNLHNGSSGPISWHDGAAHTGLSGAGSFVLTGPAIGIRVTMTTLPTGSPILPGDPTFYWDAGFITPIALSSPLRGQRLVFADESMTLPNFTDSIGYTLLHGTVVTITELLPTPA